MNIQELAVKIQSFDKENIGHGNSILGDHDYGLVSNPDDKYGAGVEDQDVRNWTETFLALTEEEKQELGDALETAGHVRTSRLIRT